MGAYTIAFSQLWRLCTAFLVCLLAFLTTPPDWVFTPIKPHLKFITRRHSERDIRYDSPGVGRIAPFNGVTRATTSSARLSRVVPTAVSRYWLCSTRCIRLPVHPISARSPVAVPVEARERSDSQQSHPSFILRIENAHSPTIRPHKTDLSNNLNAES